MACEHLGFQMMCDSGSWWHTWVCELPATLGVLCPCPVCKDPIAENDLHEEGFVALL